MAMLVPSRTPVALGASDISIFPLGWGMWRLARSDGADDRSSVVARIEAALDCGITLFDTADIYGVGTPAGFGRAETLLGEALAARPDLRARMVIATKGGIDPGKPYDSSPAYLAAALDASLTRLGVEQVDLWQVHRRDFLTHPHEVAAALTAMVESGKVRAVGVSNYTPAEADALQAFLPFALVSTQPELSAAQVAPLYDGTLDHAMARHMAVLAWSPLGGGRLAAAGSAAGALLAVQGERFGADAAAAALSWLLVHPARPVPIIGSQEPARIAGAMRAFAVKWTRGEWYAVLEAARGAPMP